MHRLANLFGLTFLSTEALCSVGPKKTTIMSHIGSPALPNEVQPLTAEEVRLITLYRKAGDRVRIAAIRNLSGSSEFSDDSEEADIHSDQGEIHSEGAQHNALLKRKLSLESTTQTKRARIGPGSEVSFDMRHIKNPRRPVPCVIQVDGDPLIGKFEDTRSGICTKLFLDAGRFGSPRIGLIFSRPNSPGLTPTQFARIDWRVDDHVQSRWVIRKLVAAPLRELPPNDIEVYHPCVIQQCPKKDIHALHYISLDLTPFMSGFCTNKAWADINRDKENHGASLKTIFRSNRD